MAAFQHALPRLLSERRSFRLLRPGVQLRLVSYVLAVSLVFGLLFAVNSWAAYARLFEAVLEGAPTDLAADVTAQTHHYARVTLVLLAAYGIAVVALTIAYLNRLLGPTVAIERHVRALEMGNYRSRIELRGDDAVYHELAGRLNRLAQQLDRPPLDY